MQCFHVCRQIPMETYVPWNDHYLSGSYLRSTFLIMISSAKTRTKSWINNQTKINNNKNLG